VKNIHHSQSGPYLPEVLGRILSKRSLKARFPSCVLVALKFVEKIYPGSRCHRFKHDDSFWMMSFTPTKTNGETRSSQPDKKMVTFQDFQCLGNHLYTFHWYHRCQQGRFFFQQLHKHAKNLMPNLLAQVPFSPWTCVLWAATASELSFLEQNDASFHFPKGGVPTN